MPNCLVAPCSHQWQLRLVMFGLALLHFDVAKLLHVNSHILVKNVRWFYPLTVHKWVVTVSSSASSLCQHSWFTVRVGIGCSHLRVAATREEEVRWQLLEQFPSALKCREAMCGGATFSGLCALLWRDWLTPAVPTCAKIPTRGGCRIFPSMRTVAVPRRKVG